jgi:hypothetical protein
LPKNSASAASTALVKPSSWAPDKSRLVPSRSARLIDTDRKRRPAPGHRRALFHKHSEDTYDHQCPKNHWKAAATKIEEKCTDLKIGHYKAWAAGLGPSANSG